MDGNELARHLRATQGLAQTVLIAITGYSQESDRKNSLAAGFHHYLIKPVDVEKLGILLNEVRAA